MAGQQSFPLRMYSDLSLAAAATSFASGLADTALSEREMRTPIMQQTRRKIVALFIAIEQNI